MPMMPSVWPTTDLTDSIEIPVPRRPVVHVAFEGMGSDSAPRTRKRSRPVRAYQVRKPLPGSTIDEALEALATKHGRHYVVKARKDLAAALSQSGFPESLKSLRLAAGLSQKELAMSLVTSQSYIARLESGQIRKPSVQRIKQLSIALSVDAAKLLTLFHA